MKIIVADQRLTEPRGVKALIVGPTGVGKTSLLRTLDPACVLFVDSEAGDLAVQDLPLDTVRIDDWPTARNLACRIGGPKSIFSADRLLLTGTLRSRRGTARQSWSIRHHFRR